MMRTRFTLLVFLTGLAWPLAAQAQAAVECPSTTASSDLEGLVQSQIDRIYASIQTGRVTESSKLVAFAPADTLVEQPLSALVVADGERIGAIETLRHWQLGDVAWTALRHIRVLADGTEQPERVTLAWRIDGTEWRLLHAHVSRAVPFGSTLAVAGSSVAGPEVPASMTTRMESFWQAWTDGDFAAVASNYVERDDTLVFLPWVPDPFETWSAFQASAEDILTTAERADFFGKGVARAEEFGDAMLTTGLFSVDVIGADGAATTGDGRFSLMWIRCGDDRKVSHEHLSSFATD